MKVPYALMFVLFSFTGHAQTSDTSIPPYYVDDVDCSGAMNQQGLLFQIIGMEQFCATMLSDADSVANTKPSKGAEEIPVGAAASNGEPAMDGAIEQSATSTQIAVTKPTIETSSEAKPDAVDGAAITGPDDELAVDDTSEQSAMSTRIVATKPAIKDGRAKIIEVDDVATTGPYSDQSDDPSRLDETIE
jgi:hypothetical protein